MSVRLVYQDIAPGAENDADVTTSATARKSFSDLSQIPHGAATPLLSTLELNAWGLGGDREILSTQKVGFWSSAMSNENGEFANSPTLTVNFDSQYTSLGISMIFDEETGDYCRFVNVKWYRGDTLLADQDYYPTGTTVFCEKTVEAYSKVVIVLGQTSLPYRYAKLSRIMFGILRTFDRSELRSVKITEEINLISAEVSVNKMSFTLDSKTGVDYIFQRLQPIYAYNGETLISAFYVEDTSRNGKNLYDVSTNDAIGVLDYETIPAVMYSGKNAKQAILDVLDGKFTLDLAPELETETLTGHIPAGTRRAALHHIAFAIRAVVDTSGTDAVRVFRANTSDPAEIPPERTYTGGSVNTSAMVTAVKVTAHSYSTSGSGDSVEVNGTKYYDTKTVTTITNPTVTASDKQNVAEITDATLVNPSNVAAVAQSVYDYYTRRMTQRVKIIVDDEKPGDYVTAHTPWGDTVTGNITMMNLTVSGITAADCEVAGV